MYLSADALILTFFAKSCHAFYHLIHVRTTRGRWTLMVLQIVPQGCLAGACHAFCHLNKPLQHVLAQMR